MKRFLTTACLLVLLVVTTIAIAFFIAPTVFGQEKKAANVAGSKMPATMPAAVEWRFDQAQPDWKPALPLPGSKTVELERTTDALRVTVSEGSRISVGSLAGGVYVDLPDWRRDEWAEVVVRARTTGSVNNMRIGLNPPEGVPPAGAAQPSEFAVFKATFHAIGNFTPGGVTPIVRDGLVRTYRIHLDWGSQRTGPWRRVGLWFHAPEPGSIDILSVRVVPAASEPAEAGVTETIIELPQLKSDFALFRKALEEAHSGLYRYKTKREMDAEFAKAGAKLTRPMTLLQFRNILEPVLAAIKCGHTEFTKNQGDEISTILESAKQFPLALKFESMRAFVVLNQGLDDRAKPGMEVLAINGKSVAGILQRILLNLNQDGDIRTHQMHRLGFARGFFRLGSPGRTGFSESYRLYIGNPASFATTLRDPHTQKTVVVELAGVTNAEAAVNAEKNPVNRDVLTGIRTLQALGEKQSIRYLDGENTAFMRIPGFSKLPPDVRENFRDFLKREFALLKSNGTKNLIIDLRGNGGGSDSYGVLLFSYLTSKEFRYYDRIHMKTYHLSFRQYTDREFTAATGFQDFNPAFGFVKADPNGGWLLTEKNKGLGVEKPSENYFDGTVYILIDGGSFSTTAEFCAAADFYKRPTFIGEETGGAAEGDNGGVSTGLTLPESQLHIEIPMYTYLSVVDKGNRRRGTLPKHAVAQTIDDLAKGRDTVLEFTRELIRTGNGH